MSRLRIAVLGHGNGTKAQVYTCHGQPNQQSHCRRTCSGAAGT